MFTGLLIISAIAGLLALILEAADSRIADYGERTVVINDEKKLVVRGGSPLLFTLMDQGIFVPSACGGKGTCAYCKVTVREGGGPLLPTETPYLSPEEREHQVRISCQVKVKEDMRIEIPPEYFRIREYKVRVDQITRLTDDIKEIRFSVLDPPEGISFVPGQYTQLQVPPHGRVRDPEYRAYSIASDSADPHHLTLIIAKVEGGVVSSYVHDRLKEGDELIARGPFGDFRLQESDRDILLVATGSGLAPIRSILYQIERGGITRKTTLFFGDRRPSDLCYYDELRALEKRLPGFTYVPILSRTQPEDAWQGETGRVTRLVEERIPRNAPVDAHICGSPVMVHSVVELLEAKGIPPGHIAYDKFE